MLKCLSGVCTEAELRAQLKLMDNLQKAGRLDRTSMDVLEVEFDGEA